MGATGIPVAEVACPGKAEVCFRRNKSYFRKKWFQIIQTAIAGMIVHNNHLRLHASTGAAYRVQALLQKVFYVIRNNDDG